MKKGRVAAWLLPAMLVSAILGAALWGLRGFCVLSGSMEPTYPVGALLLTRPVAESAVAEGMAITFTASSGTVVTHRVCRIEQAEGKRHFYTKGDANEAEDASPVVGEQLLGAPFLCIPYLGYALQFLRRPPGLYLLLTAMAFGLMLAFRPAKRAGKDRQTQG